MTGPLPGSAGTELSRVHADGADVRGMSADGSLEGRQTRPGALAAVTGEAHYAVGPDLVAVVDHGGAAAAHRTRSAERFAGRGHVVLQSGSGGSDRPAGRPLSEGSRARRAISSVEAARQPGTGVEPNESLSGPACIPALRCDGIRTRSLPVSGVLVPVELHTWVRHPSVPFPGPYSPPRRVERPGPCT